MTHRRYRSTRTLAALAALTAFAAPLLAQRPAGVRASPWWEDVLRVEEILLKGKNKAVVKQAPKLARDILARSWHHPDLKQIFAELTLYEAVALANLDQDRKAVWRWHTAVNIHRPLLHRDLQPYGEKAADLFREHPPRARGDVPYRWKNAVHGVITGTSLEPPRKIEEEPPVILESSGVRFEGATRPLRVELILDEQGQVHEPVVLMPVAPHPAVVWACLRWIPNRLFAPGKLDGEPRPFLFALDVQFKVLRGASEDKRLE